MSFTTTINVKRVFDLSITMFEIDIEIDIVEHALEIYSETSAARSLHDFKINLDFKH